jgi:hypothetical protein
MEPFRPSEPGFPRFSEVPLDIIDRAFFNHEQILKHHDQGKRIFSTIELKLETLKSQLD